MFNEDRSLFFDTTNGFAVDATIKTAAGVTVRTIEGNFDAGLDNLQLLGADIEAPNPSLVCQTSDLAGVTHANTVAIASVIYRIINRNDDGTGISMLTLQL